MIPKSRRAVGRGTVDVGGGCKNCESPASVCVAASPGLLRRESEREAICSLRDSRTIQCMVMMLLLIPESRLQLGKPFMCETFCVAWLRIAHTRHAMNTYYSVPRAPTSFRVVYTSQTPVSIACGRLLLTML